MFKDCNVFWGSSLLDMSTSSTYFRAVTDSSLIMRSKIILTRNAARLGVLQWLEDRRSRSYVTSPFPVKWSQVLCRIQYFTDHTEMFSCGANLVMHNCVYVKIILSNQG